MVTRQEQIMIHLYGQIGYGNAYEMPYRTTQEGIAEAVGISRGQVSVEIRRLEDKGFVYHLKRHPTACPKRIKSNRTCYKLNALGVMTVQKMIANGTEVA